MCFYAARKVKAGLFCENTAYVVDPHLAIGRIFGGNALIRKWERWMGTLHYDDPVHFRNTQLYFEMNFIFRQIKRETIVCNKDKCCCYKVELHKKITISVYVWH